MTDRQIPLNIIVWQVLVCSRKFMALKLNKGIEITAFVKQGLAISKDTNSAAN